MCHAMRAARHGKLDGGSSLRAGGVKATGPLEEQWLKARGHQVTEMAFVTFQELPCGAGQNASRGSR
jgi:hypothetical protein